MQTSSAGLPIPILYGAQRISGNLIWTGDFQANPVNGKGKGGGKGTGQVTYSASVIIGLGQGVITPAVSTIVVTTYGIQSNGINSQLYTDLVLGYGTAAVRSTTAGSGGTGTVWANNGQTTLAALGLYLEPGIIGDGPWPYILSAHPDQALRYPGIAYFAGANVGLGFTADFPVYWLETYGNLNSTCSAGTPDADPAAVIYDLLTNPVYGLGFPKTNIDLGSLALQANSYQNYMGALGIGFSLFMNERKPTMDWIAEWLTVTNTEAVWTQGMLKFVPYGDTSISANGFSYTPDLTPVVALTNEDFIDDTGSTTEIIQISRSDPLDVYNNFKIEILDRQYDYNSNIIETKDQATIEQYSTVVPQGVRTAPTITAHFICNGTMASTLLQLAQNRAIYVRSQYIFSVSW